MLIDESLKLPRPLYVARPLEPDRSLLHQLIDGIVDRAWYSNFGELHLQLERALGERLAAPELLLFNNGTQALVTAIRAFELEGEIITTPFTFPATPHAISWAGATPVFADVEPDWLTLDPGAVERAITSRTTAILAVHVYGVPCDVESLAALAKKHGLRLIFDAAHAFGTTYLERPIHRFGDATMLSFHATKLFHCGEGGALVINEAGARHRAKLERNFGIIDEFQVELEGGNGKMSEMQAATGLAVLTRVDAEFDARERVAAAYRRALAGLPGIRLPKQRPRATESMQYFPIYFDSRTQRDTAYDTLRAHNIFSRKYFYPLCTENRAYVHRFSSDAFPVAKMASERVLCLPMHSGVDGLAMHALTSLLARLAGASRVARGAHESAATEL